MSDHILQLPLTHFKGVGKKLNEKLAQMGVSTLEDVLFHFPLRYQDRTKLSLVGELREGMDAYIQGTIRAAGVTRGRRSTLIVKLEDGTGLVTLRFFHFRRAQVLQMRVGSTLTAFGQPKFVGGQLELIHPEYHVGDQTPDLASTLTPVYPTTEGVGQATWRNLTTQALHELANNPPADYLGDVLSEQLGLSDAITLLHRPPASANIQQILDSDHPAHHRLALEELTAHQLSMLNNRQRNEAKSTHSVTGSGDLAARLKAALPFQLTAAQQRVCQEIRDDLQRSTPMLRLLQGDVGSGKTLVAAISAAHIVESGHQVALMAPTELLSEQHYAAFDRWFTPLGITVLRLTGQIKGKARAASVEAIANGAVDIVIGTHALFQESVSFSSLGLVLVDEQHRFGVNQRLSLTQRGIETTTPHQLTMTATPIPRTLSMVAYADLDCSVIDELPPGRQAITTSVIDSERRQSVIQRVGTACREGKQAYWVCPLIEESELLSANAAEETYSTLQAELPDLTIALLHGKLASDEKASIMAEFAAGNTHILVATTVIEVGVDVPNASLMIIENAERFGLAQLHQLRGRVGRGSIESHCLLIFQSPLSQTARERLTVMRESQDGFIIAEKDLAIRGPGEVLGTRQTGLSSFRVARLPEHEGLLQEAQVLAKELIRSEPTVANALENRWTRDRQAFGQV